MMLHLKGEMWLLNPLIYLFFRRFESHHMVFISRGWDWCVYIQTSHQLRLHGTFRTYPGQVKSSYINISPRQLSQLHSVLCVCPRCRGRNEEMCDKCVSGEESFTLGVPHARRLWASGDYDKSWYTTLNSRLPVAGSECYFQFLVNLLHQNMVYINLCIQVRSTEAYEVVILFT